MSTDYLTSLWGYVKVEAGKEVKGAKENATGTEGDNRSRREPLGLLPMWEAFRFREPSGEGRVGFLPSCLYKEMRLKGQEAPAGEKEEVKGMATRATTKTAYEEFAESFFEALAKTKDSWTTDIEGHLIKSRENTQQILTALREAAGAMGNIGLLLVLAQCES